MGADVGKTPTIWWSNAVFFVSIHIAACVGVYYRPIWSTHTLTIALAVALFQCAMFGITVGYHRLYSHQSFRAGNGVRAVLALLGASACQGSIKWWALRHRLHHRYTDDPVHDPYAATRGLLWSHMGWIFYKQTYERMKLVDAKDLEVDKIVSLQHRYYVPITLLMAFLTPVGIGALWGDAPGAFVWAGLVKCLFVWHCTFLINSAAHWDGVQPYSDEDTSRTNLLLALLTGGEGNHNFHSFPHDFRSGPTLYEWDPSKWLILGLHYFSLATNLKRARQRDLDEAKRLMSAKQNGSARNEKALDAANPQMNVPSWTMDEARAYAVANSGRCVLVINDCFVDATAYLSEHPGGALILRKYALRGMERGDKDGTNADAEPPLWKQATSAFGGGLNNHSRAAKRRLEELVIARVASG